MALSRLKRMATSRRGNTRRPRTDRPGGWRRLLERRYLVRGGLGVAIVAAIVVVGLHQHGHFHGDLRVIDSEGNVVLVPEWRLGNESGESASLGTVPEGEFSFQLSNADGVPHDFKVVRTDRSADELPVRNGRVDLSAAGETVGEIDAVQPGEEGAARSIDLESGNYVLYCDVPGHYSGGMYYQLQVE
ncbi:MAG: sulfocyanin-like copper-binding protein [Dehalococcoidia bacterium]|nr:sulfocyanin-like copper-binding protein [Dehalococcoidia bacterium]